MNHLQRDSLFLYVNESTFPMLIPPESSFVEVEVQYLVLFTYAKCTGFRFL